MPQNTTLEYVADLVIRRAIAEIGKGPGLAPALERIYPFSNSGRCRQVWEKALDRHNIKTVSIREERLSSPEHACLASREQSAL